MRSSDASIFSPLDRSPDSGKNGRAFVGVALGFTDHNMRPFVCGKDRGSSTFGWEFPLGSRIWIRFLGIHDEWHVR